MTKVSEGADTNVQKSKRFGIPDRLKRGVDLESLSKGGSAFSLHDVVVHAEDATTDIPSVARITSAKVSEGADSKVQKASTLGHLID